MGHFAYENWPRYGLEQGTTLKEEKLFGLLLALVWQTLFVRDANSLIYSI